MTKGFFFTSCLAVFMIASCENPKKFDPVELKDKSSLEKKLSDKS